MRYNRLSISQRTITTRSYTKHRINQAVMTNDQSSYQTNTDLLTGYATSYLSNTTLDPLLTDVLKYLKQTKNNLSNPNNSNQNPTKT